MSQTNVVTYEPDNSIKKGFWSIFGEVYHEIAYNKWLTWQLFKRDFTAMYKQSVLGIILPLVIPLVSIGTFFVLNNAKIFSIGDLDVPYPIFALLGMIVWQLFTNSLSASSSSLTSAGAMLTKINFSKKSLIIASSGRAVVSFLTQLVLLIVLFLIYKIPVHWEAVFVFPLVIFPIMLLAISLGSLLAVINSIIRDISSLLPMALTFCMFLTPVLYVRAEQGLLAKVTDWNPFFYYIEMARNLILKGEFVQVRGFVITVIISVFISFISLIFFHLTETRIAERV